MPTTRKPIPTQATLLSLSEDALRRALAHVPLQHHGALAQTCKRLRAVKQATRFRRERANSGCEESVLIVTGGSDARDDTWALVRAVWDRTFSVLGPPAGGTPRAGDAVVHIGVSDFLYWEPPEDP